MFLAPEAIAFYLASGYRESSVWISSFNQHINSVLDMLNQVKNKYSENYNIVFKSHNNRELKEEEIQFLEENNIKILPNNIPLEIITLVYNNIKLGGFEDNIFYTMKSDDIVFIFTKNSSELSLPLNKIAELKFKVEYIQPIRKEVN